MQGIEKENPMKFTLPLLALLLAGSAHAQNAMGSHPDTRLVRGPSCASIGDVCSYAGTCDAYDCPEPKGTHANVVLKKCMVDLRTITDPELRKWCERQSLRLP